MKFLHSIPAKRLCLVILAFILLLTAIISLAEGPIKISFFQFISLAGIQFGRDVDAEIFSPYTQETLWTVLWSIRLPRVLLAVLAGAALALAGAGLQGLFRNPLADPSLIGVSAGAAIGAVSAIVLLGGSGLVHTTWAGQALLPVSAFVCGVGTTFCVYNISKVEGRTLLGTMLLAGIAVNALASALIGAMLFLSDNTQLRDFTYWSLGSLSGATWNNLLPVAVLVIPALIVFPFFARPLNAFLLGEAEAYFLGVDVGRLKKWIVFICAAMVGATVAACGIISFVGLVVPHIVRSMVGPDHRYVIPGSALLGALLLVSADLLARTVLAPVELPIGVVTAVLGAPFFIGLLYYTRHTIWS